MTSGDHNNFNTIPISPNVTPQINTLKLMEKGNGTQNRTRYVDVVYTVNRVVEKILLLLLSYTDQKSLGSQLYSQ